MPWKKTDWNFVKSRESQNTGVNLEDFKASGDVKDDITHSLCVTDKDCGCQHSYIQKKTKLNHSI